MEGQVFTATLVRVGLRVLVVADHLDNPPDGIDLGPATADDIYRTYYADTHCLHGHDRATWHRPQRSHTEVCGACRSTRDGRPIAPTWTWGAPSDGRVPVSA